MGKKRLLGNMARELLNAFMINRLSQLFGRKIKEIKFIESKNKMEIIFYNDKQKEKTFNGKQ